MLFKIKLNIWKCPTFYQRQGKKSLIGRFKRIVRSKNIFFIFHTFFFIFHTEFIIYMCVSVYPYIVLQLHILILLYIRFFHSINSQTVQLHYVKASYGYGISKSLI